MYLLYLLVLAFECISILQELRRVCILGRAGQECFSADLFLWNSIEIDMGLILNFDQVGDVVGVAVVPNFPTTPNRAGAVSGWPCQSQKA